MKIKVPCKCLERFDHKVIQTKADSPYTKLFIIERNGIKGIMKIRLPILLIVLFVLTSCKLNITFAEKAKKSVLSGIVSPLLGSIVENNHLTFFASTAVAAACGDPVTVKLFAVRADGTINEDAPVATQTLGVDARFEFAMNAPINNAKVSYLVQAYGCNNDLYKRPVTAFNSNQNLDAKTTVVAEVVNASTLLGSTLYQADKAEVESLINSLSGTSTGVVLNDLISDANHATKFTSIFNASPAVLRNASPNIYVTLPGTINELASANFSLDSVHIDPAYSMAYQWQLNSVDNSAVSTMSFIPTANQAGMHSVNLIVGQLDTINGGVDLSMPHFTKTYMVNVNNNIMPSSPAITHSGSSTSHSVVLDIDTGIGLANCESFSKMAITESATPPGISQFIIDCATAPTQQENFTLSANDGTKTVYLWTRDSEGMISTPTTTSIVVDTEGPTGTITLPSTILPGGVGHTVDFTATDSGSGLQSVQIYYSSNSGGTYSLLTTPANTDTSFTYTPAAVDIATARLKLRVTDLTGAMFEVETPVFTIDSSVPTAPSITLHTSNPSSSSIASVTISSCAADVDKVILLDSSIQPIAADIGWQNCVTTAGGSSITLSGDGTHTLHLWAKDSAGNISATAETVSTIIDTTAPVIPTGPVLSKTVFKGGATDNITWSITDLTTTSAVVSYSTNGSTYTTIGTVAGSVGTLSWTMPVVTSDTVTLRMVVTDALGFNTTKTSSNFIIDTTAPSLTAGQLIINSGQVLTSNYVPVALGATDGHSNVSEVCLKYNDPVAPGDVDSCWSTISQAPINLTPAKTLALSGYYFTLGFGQGNYEIYAWVKDEAGNMSTLSSSGAGTAGRDKVTVNYNPGLPPVISSLVAANLDLPQSKIESNESTVEVGDPVYIRWKVTDDNPLPAGKISLYYLEPVTTVWMPVPGASALSNTANNGCTVNNPNTVEVETGCFTWASSPTNEAYQIEIRVEDSNSMNSSSSSNLINGSPINIIAGNTSAGVNGSAKSAAIFNNAFGEKADVRRLAVTQNGIVYINDDRGIFRISPEQGKMELLIKNTGTLSGVGGAANNLTLCGARAITVDLSGRLIIRDCEAILRLSNTTKTATVTRIIGGGNTTADNTAALSFEVTSLGTLLTSLPNGDIWFDENPTGNIGIFDANYYIYHAATGLITKRVFSGQATFGDSAFPLTGAPSYNMGFSYNPATSVPTFMMFSTGHITNSAVVVNPVTGAGIDMSPYPLGHENTWSHSETKVTGMDGMLYSVNYSAGMITKYNPTNNTFEIIIGTMDGRGYCVDNTLATNCRIDARDLFVRPDGTIYFLDSGRIRIVQNDGTVLTLFGQSNLDGDDGPALGAKIGTISYMTQTNDGKIQFIQNLDSVIREIDTTGLITRVAGNGNSGRPTLNQNSKTTGLSALMAWGTYSSFVSDPVTKDIFMGIESDLYRLNRGVTPNVWSQITNLTGAATTEIADGDGDNAADITPGTAYGNMTPGVVSLVGNKLIVNWFLHVNNGDYNKYKAYDRGDSYKQSHVVGTDGIKQDNTFCPDGQNANTCEWGWGGYGQFLWDYDPVDDLYVINDKQGAAYFLSISNPANPMILGSVPVGRTPLNMTYHRFVGTGGASDEEVLFYCSGINGSSSGRLFKRVLNGANAGEVELPWTFGSLECTGATSIYDATNDRLIFSFIQNGLTGIAEYENPSLNPLVSCAAIKLKDPSATSGTYTIDPDGPGGAAPVSTTCTF